MSEYEKRDAFRILFRIRYEGVIQGPRLTPNTGKSLAVTVFKLVFTIVPMTDRVLEIIYTLYTYVLECRHLHPLCTMFENILKRLIRISVVSRDKHSTTVISRLFQTRRKKSMYDFSKTIHFTVATYFSTWIYVKVYIMESLKMFEWIWEHSWERSKSVSPILGETILLWNRSSLFPEMASRRRQGCDG